LQDVVLCCHVCHLCHLSFCHSFPFHSVTLPIECPGHVQFNKPKDCPACENKQRRRHLRPCTPQVKERGASEKVRVFFPTTSDETCASFRSPSLKKNCFNNSYSCQCKLGFAILNGQCYCFICIAIATQRDSTKPINRQGAGHAISEFTLACLHSPLLPHLRLNTHS